MSFTFESTEALLRELSPAPLAAKSRQRLRDAIEAQDIPVLGDEHRRIELILSDAKPKCLHPQQAEVFNGAELDGSCEAQWAGSCQPVQPSSDLKNRMSASMASAEHVGGVAPVALSSGLLDRIVAGMDSISENSQQEDSSSPKVSPKVLAFPGQQVRKGNRSSSVVSGALLKVAAAVAIFGAAVGSFIPQLGSQLDEPMSEVAATSADESSSGVTKNSQPVVPAYINLISPSMVPASYASDVRAPRERGMIVDDVNRALYRVEFDEVEEMVLIDEKGRERTFERPRGKRQVLLPVDTQ